MDFFNNEVIDRIFNIVEILLLILVVGILGFSYFKYENNEETEIVGTNDILTDSQDETTLEVLEPIRDEFVFVDIKGAVKKPGVYKLLKGSLVNDVIKVAGGLKSTASTKNINLSRKVSDEMVIIVYTESQLNKMNVKTDIFCKSDKVEISDCNNSSIIEKNESGLEDKSNSSSNTDSISKKISINYGTKDELMTLSGIGESKALAIIDYREKNGLFKKLEELMNVSGIGEAAYNKIKENITL